MTDLQQFGSDIWITDKPVASHTDSTAEGMLTYGLVLVNTGYVLNYGGKRLAMPAGSIYVIDGRKEHSTEGTGVLVLLIWDMPNWTADDFKRELKQDARFANLPEPREITQ
jgi:hypothetical protein